MKAAQPIDHDGGSAMLRKIRIVALACLLAAVPPGLAGAAQGKGLEAPSYDGEPAQLQSYESPQAYLEQLTPAAADDKAALYYDPSSGNIALQSKADGSVWFSAPYAIADADISTAQKQLASSPIVLTYADSQLKTHELGSFKDCAAYGQLTAEPIENGVRFRMTVGKTAQSEVVPQVLPDARLDQLEEGLDDGDYRYLVQSYRRLRADGADAAQQQEYPGLQSGDVYILRSNVTPQVKKKLTALFTAAGYGRDQLLEDERAVYGAAKTVETESAHFTLTVAYTLDHGDLVVTVPLGEIAYDTARYQLLDLTVLRCFGAAGRDDSGLFLLPDGSGAVSEYQAGQTGTGAPFEVNLYGTDAIYPYDAARHTMQSARAPVYGQRKGDSGYIAIAEEGEAQLAVRSVIDESESALRYTHFVCHVRPSAEYIHSEYASYDAYTRAAPDAYTGSYTVRYRLLHPAGYSDMAAAYRGYLLETGVLRQAEQADAPPLTVELLGAVEAPYDGLVSDSRLYPLTTYAQATDILRELKDDGARNLTVRLSGWANGGLDYTVFRQAKLLSLLGGPGGFAALADTAAAQGVGLYPAVDVAYAHRDAWFDGFTLSRDAAHQLDNTYARTYPYNRGSSLGDYTRPAYAVRGPSMVKYMASFLRAYSYPSTGLLLASLGEELHSDSRKGAGSRTDSLADYRTVMEQAAERYRLLVTGGNAYTWAYAAGIQGLPSSSSGYRNTSYSVPFLQMVLHGYIPYTGGSLNLSPNPQTALLKAIENGEGLLYTLAKDQVQILAETDHADYLSVEYGFWKERIRQDQETLHGVLAGTYASPIAAHAYLTPEVVRVTYENGTAVWINYAETAYSAGGITIPAKSALARHSDDR